MNAHVIAYNIGYVIGFYGPIILASAVITAIILWAMCFFRRCDRDD